MWPQEHKVCGGCNDPALPQHKCLECNENFHNSCLLYYHTYQSGTVPEGGDPFSGKTARVCGNCVTSYKNPLKLVPVVWHRYNKLVWQALQNARTNGTPFVPPCGRPALDHIETTSETTDSQQVQSATATTDTQQVQSATESVESQTASENTGPQQVQTATTTTDSQQVQTATATTATTGTSQQDQTTTATTDSQVQTATKPTDPQTTTALANDSSNAIDTTQNASTDIDTDVPADDVPAETFEIDVPCITTVAQRGVSLVRFFGKKPEWHCTLFLAPGIVCQTRPRHAFVPGSQFDMQSENAERMKSFCVIFPGLWIGFASGSRQRTPRRKAPMRVVVIEEEYLDLPAPDALLQLQVISCNRVKSVLFDKQTKLYPEVSTSMNSRCLILQNKIIELTKNDIDNWKPVTRRIIRTFKEITASAARRARAEKRRKEQSERGQKRVEKRKAPTSAPQRRTRTKKGVTPLPPPPALVDLESHLSEQDTDHEVSVY